jgi:uncharacterized membrane protein
MKDITDNHYKPDFEIADRYINFSSELLRLSILAITAIATLIFFTIKSSSEYDFNPTVTNYLISTLLLFAVTAAAALFHRFYASDFLSYHISYLRTSDEDEREKGRKCLNRATLSLIIAELAIGLAVLSFVITVVLLIKQK